MGACKRRSAVEHRSSTPDTTTVDPGCDPGLKTKNGKRVQARLPSLVAETQRLSRCPAPTSLPWCVHQKCDARGRTGSNTSEKHNGRRNDGNDGHPVCPKTRTGLFRRNALYVFGIHFFSPQAFPNGSMTNSLTLLNFALFYSTREESI